MDDSLSYHAIADLASYRSRRRSSDLRSLPPVSLPSSSQPLLDSCVCDRSCDAVVALHSNSTYAGPSSAVDRFSVIQVLRHPNPLRLIARSSPRYLRLFATIPLRSLRSLEPCDTCDGTFASDRPVCDRCCSSTIETHCRHRTSALHTFATMRSHSRHPSSSPFRRLGRVSGLRDCDVGRLVVFGDGFQR